MALLEAARAFDAWGVRPPVDVWLCWFGSHERGMYGSTAFALAHQDLAVLQRIPGVGKKSAQRMVLDIGDKLGLPASLAQKPAIPHMRPFHSG